jgi:DNA repair photolyase
MVEIKHKQAHGILSKATGFIRSFDYTLNPYSGCTFGCSYCYAAFFAPTPEEQADWGNWVTVKENALILLQKKRKRPLIDKTIYVSSVTDPYQPIERKLELTRAILQELADYHSVYVVIQTRSPLVVRDVDVLKNLAKVRVNMTITTDDETIRKAFEPLCPSNIQRLEAITEVTQAGIPSAITMTPLLPIQNPQDFIERLKATGVKKFMVQDFHVTKARFVAGTGEQARKLLAERQWGQSDYLRMRALLMHHLPDCKEGELGFAP